MAHDDDLSPLNCEFCGKDMGFCELPKDRVPAAFCREKCVEDMRAGKAPPERRERKPARRGRKA